MPINWYTAHVGGVFEVVDHETDDKKYVVVNSKGTSLRRLIYKADCVILKTDTGAKAL